MPTVIASQRVREERLAEYRRAQDEIGELVRNQPGFLGTEVIPPVAGLQEDWVAIFRFDSNGSLQRWLNHPERRRLVDRIGGTLAEPASYQVVADDESKPTPATAVFSHRIRPGRESEFSRWKQRIIRARSRFPGYLGSEMFEPVPGVQEDWIDIVRFDTAAHLDEWLRSEERRRLVGEAEKFSEKIEARPLATGLESWFRLDGRTGGEADSTPVWKQSLLVLLALYPTVMLLQFTVDPWLASVPLPIRILVGNVIGVALLAWVLLPRLTRWMGFWLDPAPARPRGRTDLAGTGVVLTLLALFLGLFLLVA